MVASEHPEVVQGRWQLVAMDILDSQDAAEDVFIEDDGSALVEERESGLIEAGVSTCVTEL